MHDAPGASVTPLIETVVLPVAAPMLPPQVLLSPFGVATFRPLGRPSAKLMLVSVVNVGFGLAMLNVSDVDWPIRMLAAPNAFASVGAEGTGTLIDADAEVPVPLSVAPIAVVVLFLAPAEVAVTSTLHVHDAPGASVTPLIETVVLPVAAPMLPPQVLLSPFGVATFRPLGRPSAKLMLVSVVNVGFGLAMLNVSDVDWPIRMLAAPNAFASVGAEGTGTLIDADAGVPVPLSVAPIAVVVLFLAPAEVAVTSTLHVHDAPGASVTPLIETVVLPVAAPMLPPQVLLSPFGVATFRPLGRPSAKLMLVSVVNVGFGLAMLNVSDVDWPIRMLAAPNAFASVGGRGVGTLIDADAGVPVPLSVAPIAVVVLFLAPAEVAVTSTLHVHDAPGASVTPLIETVVLPVAAPMLPPQVLLSPFGVATFRPLGRPSAKLMLVSVVPTFGLATVNVSDVDWPIRMLAAPNALASVGGSPAAHAG